MTRAPAPTTLGQLDFKSNAIGFLRIALASIVVWSHSLLITSGRDPGMAYSHNAFNSGLLAVGGFFVLSGFLITRSAESLQNPSRFMWHRALRIYPGFWACLFVTAFVLAPIMYFIESGALHGYLTSPDGPFSYIYRNALVFYRQTDIANLITSGPSPKQIDAPLWTLPWEMACYIIVALFGLFAVYRRPLIVPIVTGLLLIGMLTMESALRHAPIFEFSRALFLFISFGAGSSAYFFRSRIPMRWSLVVAAAIVMAVALPTPFARSIAPIPLAYLTLYVSMFLPIRSFDRRVDLSYGLYIYSLPLQYILVMLGVQHYGFILYWGSSMAIGLAFAAASWFLVERQALRFKNIRLARAVGSVASCQK